MLISADAHHHHHHHHHLDQSIASTHPLPPPQIIDYGKFKYSLEKKKKEQKKKAKTTEVKEVKMSYKIENHDYGVRMKQVRKNAPWRQTMPGVAFAPHHAAPFPDASHLYITPHRLAR